MRGAIREDDNEVEVEPRYQDEPGGTFRRVYGHFHDPEQDRGLTIAALGTLGLRAANWALKRSNRVRKGESLFCSKRP